MGFVKKKKEKKDPNRPRYGLIIRNFSSSESEDEDNAAENTESPKPTQLENVNEDQGQKQGHSHGGHGHSHAGHGHGHSHGHGEGCAVHDFEVFQKRVKEKEEERKRKRRSFLRWKDKVAENEKPCTKEEYAVAKHLRFNCPNKDSKFIPMGTVVKTFIGSEAVDTLLKSKWAQPSKSDILLSDRKSCEKFCERLLQKGLFHRALKLEKKKSDKLLKKKKKTEEQDTEEDKEKKSKKDKKSKKEKTKEEKETEEKEEDQSVKKEDKKDDDKKKDEEKKKKERKLKVDMHDDQVFLDGDDLRVADISTFLSFSVIFIKGLCNLGLEILSDKVYVWIYDPVPAKTFIIGLLMVIGAAALCLFPLWPDQLRVGVYYCSLAGASFVGFILVLVIIRFVLFCAIWFLTLGKLHFWFLPNLTEDVGFFDSFRPLYKYDTYTGKEEENLKKKKKEKKQKKVKEIEETKEEQEQGFEMVQKEDVVDDSEKKNSDQDYDDEKENDNEEDENGVDEEDEEEEEEEEGQYEAEENDFESKKEK